MKGTFVYIHTRRENWEIKVCIWRGKICPLFTFIQQTSIIIIVESWIKHKFHQLKFHPKVICMTTKNAGKENNSKFWLLGEKKNSVVTYIIE